MNELQIGWKYCSLAQRFCNAHRQLVVTNSAWPCDLKRYVPKVCFGLVKFNGQGGSRAHDYKIGKLGPMCLCGMLVSVVPKVAPKRPFDQFWSFRKPSIPSSASNNPSMGLDRVVSGQAMAVMGTATVTGSAIVPGSLF